MARAKKSSKLELQEYASLWLHHTGMNDAEISDKLGIDIDTIAAWTKSKQKTKQRLTINETAGKKNKSVSIMTMAASQASDELRKAQGQTSTRNNNCIFRPND